MAFGHILFLFTTQLLVLAYGQPTTNYAEPDVCHQVNTEVINTLQKLSQKVDMLQEVIDSLSEGIVYQAISKCLLFIITTTLCDLPLYTQSVYTRYRNTMQNS